MWDKAATIQFVKPGRGAVTTTFHIPLETIEGIRAQADAGEKLEPVFTVDVVGEQGGVVAKMVAIATVIDLRFPSLPRASAPRASSPRLVALAFPRSVTWHNRHTHIGVQCIGDTAQCPQARRLAAFHACQRRLLHPGPPC